MAKQIGYFPEYFEGVTAPLYDRSENVAPPGEPRDEADLETTDAIAPGPRTPAPWIDTVPFLTPDDAATTAVEVADHARELLDPSAIDLNADLDLVEHWIKPKQRRRLRLSADAIAVYRPWHLHGADWGIYISEEALGFFTAGLARLTGAPLGQLAPLALRQVLEHEWVHFAFEVAATEVEDVAKDVLYPAYVRERFARANPHSPGPGEEIVASWAEVEFARNPGGGFRRLKPRGYRRAVEYLLSIAPPGYSEYHLMKDWDQAVDIVAYVMSSIRGEEIRTWRWGRLDDAEKRQVPVYWLGDPTTAPAFGAFPKSVGPPTIKRLQQWLRHIGAKGPLPRRGKGSHQRWELPGGTPFGFATSAPFLLPPEAKNLAAALGITRQELFDHIGRMARLPSMESAR